MRIVLLSGGSGKRLWPLSNGIRSKVFLKLLSSGDGSKESMIQRVCRQLDSEGLLSSTYIVTHKSQVEITQSHIGDTVPIISEPYKRGTFTAIALAAAYFHSKLNAGPDETLCILPVDLFVETAFFRVLDQFPNVLSGSGADLALVGAAPEHPSNQYGYIVPHLNNKPGYLSVAEFVEKPDEVKASRLIHKHALWNCGVFAFSLKFMLSYMDKTGLPVQYEPLLERYKELPEVSFDHEVVEKTAHSVVIPYNGTWRDLGSWDTLTDHIGNSVTGSGQVSHDSLNTHLVNELPYPVHIIDVSNVIVAASPDGILVASKSKSSLIKEKLTNGMTRTMYEETSWGTGRVLDYSKTCTEAREEIETLTKKMELHPGKEISCHMHQNRMEIWTIISGSGELTLDGRTQPVQTGDVLQIPRGAIHGMKAVTPMEMIEVQIGSGLTDEDINYSAISGQTGQTGTADA